MKKIITAFLAASLIIGAAASCAKRTKVDPTDNKLPEITVGATDPAKTPSSGDVGTGEITTETDVNSLEPYDGWWKHVGALVAGDPMVEIFEVDAASGTWTEYSANGIRGGTYTCYADERGLNMEYGDIGITTFMFDGVSLLNYAGYIEYIPGEPVEEVSPSAYDGKWYELGDTDGPCLVITGDSYILDYVSGGWDTVEVDTEFEGGIVRETRIRLLDRPGVELVVADKGGALYDPENNNAYIHERELGTIRGDDLIKKYDLICHEWAGESADKASVVFGFYDNKFYLVNTVTLGGETQVLKEVAGTWSIHEYELSLHYADGHEEITPYDPERLMFSYYKQMVVTKVDK